MEKFVGAYYNGILEMLKQDKLDKEKQMSKLENRNVSKSIWVKFCKEGIHKYPAALEDPKLKEVSFLGYPHRHVFHFEVEVEVFHDDRDIEFILFKRELEALYDEKTLELDYKSCEMISDDLASYIIDKYPGRDIDIVVSEDGENGSRASYKIKKGS